MSGTDGWFENFLWTSELSQYLPTQKQKKKINKAPTPVTESLDGNYENMILTVEKRILPGHRTSI
jgi:hypothetical protein